MDMQGISGRYFMLYCFAFSFNKLLCFPFFIFCFPSYFALY